MKFTDKTQWTSYLINIGWNIIWEQTKIFQNSQNKTVPKFYGITVYSSVDNFFIREVNEKLHKMLHKVNSIFCYKNNHDNYNNYITTCRTNLHETMFCDYFWFDPNLDDTNQRSTNKMVLNNITSVVTQLDNLEWLAYEDISKILFF